MRVDPTDPITLAGRTAPARVIFGPHETNLAERRALSQRHVDYYARRARGGAGVVVTEIASVHPADHPYERAPLAEDCADGWARTVAACRPHGTLVLAGLGHAGLQGSSAWTRSALQAPSRVPDPATRELPAEMSTADIASVLDGFRRATAVAVAADVDGVELDVGPTSLLRQFLSGLTNLRTDCYGTDRALLLRRVIATVRSELGPGRILALRLSCDENAPWAGITPELAAGHAAELAPHLDLLTVVRGGLFAPGSYRPDVHSPAGFNERLCRRIRDAVAGAVPIVLQGSIVDAAHAQRALRDGVCDAVEMTRAQIADPDLVATVRAGSSPRPCVLCNQACLVRDFHNPVVGCIGNPETGHESEPPVSPATEVRDVLVVGGGPAGLEAARTLAARGHRVQVRERADRCGGMLRAAALSAGRDRFAALADWLEERCRDGGVDLRTGTTVTAADLDDAHAAGATVVLATGSRPRPPGFPVAAGTACYATASRVLANPPVAPRCIVVWDPVGGPVAVAVAERLAALGHRVHYATCDPIAGSRLAPTGDLVDANARLQRAGITRHRGVTVRAVDPAGVHLEHPVTGEWTAVSGALLVDCSPGLPDDKFAGVGRNGVGGCGALHRIGDCIAPRTVREAIREGYRLAAELQSVSLADRRERHMGEFDGKVVFITGIARGQGRNHALRFAREGASIIGIDVAGPVSEYISYDQATRDDFDETVRLVEETGGKIVARIADVRDSAALKAAVDEGVAQFGRLDVVVANAGICSWNRFWEMPDEQFEELIDINLTGVFKTLKAAAPAMIEAGNGGSIILVSSVAGLKAMPGQINYAAAKFGLVGMTQTAAKELGEYRIRVNSIHPYGVNTPMGTDPGALKMFEKYPHWLPSFAPILTEKPIADPDDTSDAVLFLASDRAKTITGSQMALDQGNSKV